MRAEILPRTPRVTRRTPPSDLPVLAFPDQAAWRTWLEGHHETSQGVWLKIAKKSAAEASVSYPEALDEALSLGWIDGQKAALDDGHWLQRFTPRTARSKWSQVNTEKATRLIAAGRMRPAGLAAVEAAKADGRWAAAYEPQSRATVPEDLQRALDENPAAAKFFATLKGPNRYAVLYRIREAKRPETRAARIAKFVEMLAEGRTLH